MNKLFTAFALSILTAVSAFGQGLVRYSPTTNGAVAIGTLANNQVLTWMNPPGIWTNGPVVATATNAIADMSGLGTNTAFHGPITFSGSISNNGAFTNAGPARFLAGVTNLGAFTNAGNVYLGSQLYVQGSSTLIGNVGAQGDLVQTGSGVAQLLATTVTGAFTNNGNTGIGGNAYIQAGLTNGGSLSNVGAINIGGALFVGGSTVLGGSLSVNSGNVLINGGDLTHNALTASTVLYGSGSKQVVSIANGTGMLTNNGSGTVGWMAIPSGGSGGTNYPPVIHQFASTNIAAASGVRQVRTMATNASFGFVITGTPLNGETFIVGISNHSSSQILATNLSTLSLRSPSVASNITTVAIPATSEKWIELIAHTNWAGGTAIWTIVREVGKELELAAGLNMNLATNSSGSIVTNSLNQTLTNLVSLNYDTLTMLIPTNNAASNITVNLSHTNVVEIWATNNLTFTNWVGVPDNGASGPTILIRPQLITRGVNWGNLGLSNPGYSVAIGTNANNLLWTSLTNGKTYALSIFRVRTNLFPTITLWE